MNLKHDPLFWGAVRIERSLARRARRMPALCNDSADLLQRQQAVQRATDRWLTAQRRGWLLAASQLQDELLHQIRRLHWAAGNILARADQPLPPVPSLRELLADLRQLSTEFEHFSVLPKENLLVAETPPIELEGLALGSFVIQLHLDRLSGQPGSGCFSCVALEPNPAAGNDAVTHPHVSGNALCAGDAAVPIATALTQGRISDAFCMVRAVLETYNPNSPYVSIEEWDGIRCTDCDGIVRSDQLNHCESCGSDFCDDCFSFCDLCEQSYCRSCLEYDRVSDQRCCSDCRGTCSDCGRTVDSSNFSTETELCPRCHAEHEEQEQPSEPALLENDHDPIPTIPESQPATAA